MTDPRRGNYIQLTADRKRLDLLKIKYLDIRFALNAVKKVVITDPYESNLPGIAYKLWGDPDYGYWWVLGLFNGIVDPLEDVETGTELLVPDIDQVKKYLQSVSEEGVSLTSNVVEL